MLGFLKKLYVILDAEDNSVTLSPRLAEIVMNRIVDENKIHMFKVGEEYAFSVNHPQLMDKDTPFAPLQKNMQYDCIGFNACCPSVNRIVYDYHLPDKVQVKIKRVRCGKETIYVLKR